MARLPQPGGDSGNWGDILNDYLRQAHKADGILEDNSVTADTIAPGAVTKADVGLSNVDNTADANKPVSTAQQTALDTKLNTADLDAEVADNISTDGTATRTALDSVITDTTASPTKRVTMSLGAPRTAGPAAVLTDWAERIPILLPVTTTRWRLRVGNRHLGNTGMGGLTTPYTIGPIYRGVPATPAGSGRHTGAWSATPTQAAAGGTTPVDGTDWTSAWVTDPALQFTAGRIGMVATNISTPAAVGTGASTTGSHYGFRNSNAGAASSVATLAATNYFGNTLALDKRLEYEFKGDNPVGFYVGASGDEGYNTSTPFAGGGGFEHLPSHEAWPGVMGMRLGIPWVNAAIVGATQAPYLSSSSPAYTRFDLTTTPPNFAVVDLAGNTILNGGATLAGIQAEYATCIAAIRSLGIERIYLLTVLPCGLASGDAKEILRVQVNNWLRQIPMGVQGVFDIDVHLRNPAVVQNQLAELVTGDNVHPTHGGYQRWADGITLG